MSATAPDSAVLIVEDNPVVRIDLRSTLEAARLGVCADARDGVEAVALARKHKPDLVLIDLGLPRMDGAEATRRILRFRTIPIVALTGYTAGDLVERAFSAGVTTKIAKPFHPDHLVTTINAVLGAHRRTNSATTYDASLGKGAPHPQRRARPHAQRPRAPSKEADAFIKAAWSAGWWCEMVKKGYIHAKSPDLRTTVTVPSSPGRGRAIENLRSDFRRGGLRV